MKFQDFDKTRSSLRYWLLGRNYHKAHRAMELGLEYHTGTRKDGFPEFSHQVSQAQILRTLENQLSNPEDSFCTTFLHDIVEDCDYPLKAIYSEFGDKVGMGVELMTNRYDDGPKKTKEDYYKAMSFDALASIAKMVDRVHNQQTMIGAFNPAKQLDYVNETETFIIPMGKLARKRFPAQEQAFHNLKLQLQMQIEWVRYANLSHLGTNA